MPVLSIYDNGTAGICKAPFLGSVRVLELRSCLLENLSLDLLALVILACKILRGLLGLRRVILKEKLERIR